MELPKISLSCKVLLLIFSMIVVVGAEEKDSYRDFDTNTVDRAHDSLRYEVSEDKYQKRLDSELAFAVGVNACVDLIVYGVDLMKALGIESPANPKAHEVLKNKQDLAEAFAYSFKTGTAYERVLPDHDVYGDIVKTAESLEHKTHFTGGNAALMGQHIAESANGRPRKVLLISSVGPTLKTLLHPGIDVPEECNVEKDEVHLILEFRYGEKWGPYTAPRANRFIFSYDRTNAELRPADKFHDAFAGFDATAFLFSGVHMLEAEPHDYREDRLDKIEEVMDVVPPTRPSHLELASLADLSFVKQICDNLFEKVESIGLNEQELKLVNTATDGPHKEDMEEPFEHPTVGIIADLVHHILHKYRHGRLSRVHFHTLAFHLIAVRKGTWANPRASVSWGSLACSQRACEASTVYDRNGTLDGVALLKIPKTYKLTHGSVEKFPELGKQRECNPDTIVTEWERDGLVFAMAPVVVCAKPQKTVGLGDSISAAGLEMHEFIGGY
eukprot:m.61086 g.61086  ORF g.61086 m.61086 type:complete len:499 (+) comp11376_c0_seq2:126-1622(+)